MRLVRAPAALPDFEPGARVLFLSGPVQHGQAAWQDRLARALEKAPGWLLDPRRADWDSTWMNSLVDPRFAAQVAWELAGLARATERVVFLGGSSDAPVTLLELGLYAHQGRTRICLDDGYALGGHVQAVARAWKLPVHRGLDALAQALLEPPALGPG
jgi:hypothetical protein